MLRQRESKSAPVGVMVKVLRILDALHAAPAGLQLKEIARITSINKSTAYRFLAHLESEGYLFRDDAGAYVIGPKLARLGSGINYEETLRKISRPVLQKLWQMTGETINLGILDGHELLYLDVIESAHTFRLASQIGSRRPLYCTSLGKAIAAYMPEDDIEEVFDSRTMERFTPHTITNLARLKKEFAKIRQCGYAMDDEEAVLGARCVAAPIFDEGGKVTAAISTSGPITRVTAEKARVFATAVKKGAHVISARLGYNGL